MAGRWPTQELCSHHARPEKDLPVFPRPVFDPRQNERRAQHPAKRGAPAALRSAVTAPGHPLRAEPRAARPPQPRAAGPTRSTTAGSAPSARPFSSWLSPLESISAPRAKQERPRRLLPAASGNPFCIGSPLWPRLREKVSGSGEEGGPAPRAHRPGAGPSRAGLGSVRGAAGRRWRCVGLREVLSAELFGRQ